LIKFIELLDILEELYLFRGLRNLVYRDFHRNRAGADVL
jgi:hypothetical protein